MSMNVTIAILEDAVRIDAGEKTATLRDPNPEQLARRIASQIKDESPTANVITVLPKKPQVPLADIVGKIVESHGQPLLSPVEVAVRLGVSRDVVYDLIRSGDLASVRVGTGKRQLHRITPEELERFLNQNGGEA